MPIIFRAHDPWFQAPFLSVIAKVGAEITVLKRTRSCADIFTGSQPCGPEQPGPSDHSAVAKEEGWQREGVLERRQGGRMRLLKLKAAQWLIVRLLSQKLYCNIPGIPDFLRGNDERMRLQHHRPMSGRCDSSLFLGQGALLISYSSSSSAEVFVGGSSDCLGKGK